MLKIKPMAKAKSGTKKIIQTPIRECLVDTSFLQSKVVDGLGAVQTKDKDCFHDSVKACFLDSLELDAAMLVGNEGENRWDYLLGHSATRKIVGVEPHSAKTDEVTTVIRKRLAALKQLRNHLRDGVRVERWLWVASGRVQFANTEKTKLILDQNGIEFVGTKVYRKHLP